MSDYVIKAWNVNENAQGGPHIIIEGRAAGLLSWLKGLLRIKAGVTLLVTAEKVLFTSAQAAGYITQITPLKNVCSTFYGYKKPWKQALVLAVLAVGVLHFVLPVLLCAPVGKSVENRQLIVALASAGLLVSYPLGLLIGLLYYRLNQALTLGFVEFSGKSFEISFKPSVIEDVSVTYEKAAEACNLMQSLIDAKR